MARGPIDEVGTLLPFKKMPQLWSAWYISNPSNCLYEIKKVPTHTVQKK